MCTCTRKCFRSFKAWKSQPFAKMIKTVILYCRFITRSVYLRHRTNKHPSAVAKRCRLCDNVFKSRQKLIVHVAVKHMKKLKPFKCYECDMDFARPQRLSEHIRKVHRKVSIVNEVHFIRKNEVIAYDIFYISKSNSNFIGIWHRHNTFDINHEI